MHGPQISRIAAELLSKDSSEYLQINVSMIGTGPLRIHLADNCHLGHAATFYYFRDNVILMRFLFAALLAVAPVLIQAQLLSRVPAEKVDGMFVNWAQGRIYFESGESIDCDIRFDQLNQNMDVRYQGADLEIPYTDIQSFDFLDPARHQQRYFEKVVVQSGKIVLMEYVFKGAKAALMEERFIRKFHMSYPDPTTLEKRKLRITMPIEKKFLYVTETKQALLMTYANLLTIAGDNAEDIKAFVRKHHLRMENDKDFVRVLEYYDQL